jgi:hypothetical protein
LAFGGGAEQRAKLAKQEGWETILSDFTLWECKAQPGLDKLLRDAKVPLAKKRKID